MTITQLCEKVNVDCAKLNSIVTARGGIYFFILGSNQSLKRALEKSNALVYNLTKKVIGCESDLPSVLKCIIRIAS